LDEIKAQNYKLDAFKWIRDEELDDPDDTPDPQDLLTEAMEELSLAANELAALRDLLDEGGDS
jgi:type I restriction enzyme M protein